MKGEWGAKMSAPHHMHAELTNNIFKVNQLNFNGEQYHRLEQVNTATATEPSEILSNIKANIKRELPRLHQLPEFHKPKGHDKKIALIGGGPSLKHYLDDIRQFRTVFACGSCNDYLMKNGIIPTYAGICDPDPLSINYFQRLDTETKYLVASGCDGKIFDHLKDYQVVMWHCHSDTYKPEDIEPGYQAVGGGCTIGLRAISIAIILGYTNHHFFGFDSCMADNSSDSHAYQAEDVGTLYDIKVGTTEELDYSSKTFKVAGYQLAQANHFIEFYKNYGKMFVPTIYGDGLLASVLQNINKESTKPEQTYE